MQNHDGDRCNSASTFISELWNSLVAAGVEISHGDLPNYQMDIPSHLDAFERFFDALWTHEIHMCDVHLQPEGGHAMLA